MTLAAQAANAETGLAGHHMGINGARGSLPRALTIAMPNDIVRLAFRTVETMPSEKLTRILRSKGPFSRDEIAVLSEAQGWDLVYADEAAAKDRSEQICFTGLGAVECTELEDFAAKSGCLRSSVR